MKLTPGRKRALKYTSYLAVVGLGVALVGSDAGQLEDSADQLTHLNYAWVVVAAAAELAAYVVAGLGLRILLPVDHRPSRVTTTRISLAGQAAANCLPGGPATAAVVMARQLNRRGVPERAGVGAILTITLLQAVSLPVLTLIGAQAPGADDAVPGVQTLALSFIAGVAVLAAVGYGLHRRGVLIQILRWGREHLPTFVVDAVAKALPPPAQDGTVPAAGPRDRRTLAWAFFFATAYWLLDMTCLAFAFPAVGAGIPFRGVLLAYCAAQLATTLPITPGGLGVVEGSLTLALVAFGGDGAKVLAAVLLYRLISYPGLIVVGGIASLRLRHQATKLEKELVAA